MRGLVGIAVVAGCSFTVSGSGLPDDASVTGDATDASGPPSLDAGDAMTFDAPIDTPPGVCSTAGMNCPSATTPRLLACSSDCWVGCRDGAVVTFADAEARCVAWGGKLGWIDSLAEEDCVRQTINGAIILGLKQAANQLSPSDGWSWNSDGLPVGYLHWGMGQPNDLDTSENGTEQCAFSNSFGDWHDDQCATMLSRFTCRK